MMKRVVAFGLDLGMIALWVILDYGARHPRSGAAKLTRWVKL